MSDIAVGCSLKLTTTTTRLSLRWAIGRRYARTPAASHPMLLTTPTEIQAEILSYLELDLHALAQLARVSHHIHLLAIPLLYKTVTLHTWVDLAHFFTLETSLPKDGKLAVERAKRRRADLDCIRRLVLDFPLDFDKDRPPPGMVLKPHVFLFLASRPLQLDLLRLSFGDPRHLHEMLPLLRSVNPQEMELQRCGNVVFVADHEACILLKIGRHVWTRLDKLTYGSNLFRYRSDRGVRCRSLKTTSFATVKQVQFRTSDWFSAFFSTGSSSLDDIDMMPGLDMVVALCPNMVGMTVEIEAERDRQTFTAIVQEAVRADVEVEMIVAPAVVVSKELGRTIWPRDKEEL